MSLNRVLALTPLVIITLSLLIGPSLVNADFKVTPPQNWQPVPNSNSTAMAWIQNSTNSLFAIINPQAESKSAIYPIVFPAINSFIAQFLSDQGLLESVDQTTFGQSNLGYQYIVNLNLSSPLFNSSALKQQSEFLSSLPSGPTEMMAILSEKQGDVYGIFLLSPKQNFDSVMKEIQPTIDSIQLGNSTSLANPTN